MTSQRVIKELTAGRIVIVTHKHHVNKLALVLSATMKYKKFVCRVLVLNDSRAEAPDGDNDVWYKMLGLCMDRLFSSDGSVEHEVLNVDCADIFAITSTVVKIDADFVIKDWEQRQIPRFKDFPPGLCCEQAVQVSRIINLSSVNKTIVTTAVTPFLKFATWINKVD